MPEPVYPSLPPDPTSPTYRKALRHYLSSTRPPVSLPSPSPTPGPASAEPPPLRASEKSYKRPFPPPSLSSALDLSLHSTPALHEHFWHGTLSPPHTRLPGLPSEAYTLPAHPGVVVLPGFVPPEEQRKMVRECLEGAGTEGRETSLDAHWSVPACGIWASSLSSPHTLISPRWMSAPPFPADPDPESEPRRRALVSNPPGSHSDIHTPKPPPAPSTFLRPLAPSNLVRKLRWANLGASYHWSSKTYDLSRPPGLMLPAVRSWAQRVVSAVDWDAVGVEGQEGRGGEGYEPDAGIVNFYRLGDTLMAHVDRSELSASLPLVSISLGHACVFLLGYAERDDPRPPTALILRSGDALVLSGQSRRVFHGVPRILEGTLPAYLWDDMPAEEREGWRPFGEYMAGARINVNVREVGLDGLREEGS